MTESANEILERITQERKAWPWHRKARMWFKWKVTNPVRKFPREVRWFVQRGRRGWSDYDMWGMDGYVARINVQMLAEMRRIAHGYPSGLSRGDFEEWLNEDERNARGFNIAAIDAQIGFNGDPNDGFERWKAMLAYFEDGWRCAISSMEGLGDEGHERFLEMLPLYGEWYQGLWD